MEKRNAILGLKCCCILLMLVAMYSLTFSVAYATTSTTLTTNDIADLTPDYVAPGAQKVPILTITLTDTVAEDFTRAKVRYSGTERTDITAVHLYAESTGSGGAFDPATDILLGTSGPTSTSVFTINLDPAFTFTANISQQFYFVADISETVLDGNIEDLRIYKNELTIGGNDWPDVGINPDGYSVIDLISPSIDSITGNTSGTTGEVTTIVVTASDNVDVTSARIFINGGTSSLDMVKSLGNTFTIDVLAPFDSTDNITYQVGVYDQAGNSAISEIYTITVTDNDPPVAEAGPDQTVNEDTAVSFDGSASSDNIGIGEYQWNFGDGIGEANGVNPTYIFTEPGVYTVTLIVSDAAGNSSSDTLVVTVLSTTLPPPEEKLDQIQKLLADLSLQIQGSTNVPEGIKISLISKLAVAELKLSQAEKESGIEQGELLKPASNILRAFQNALRAQGQSEKVPQDECASWSAQAADIYTELLEIIDP